ncbi:hypothetical protein ACIA6C_15645 [Streptomyces sp. NPDC051578]|uniref:hypothetical protein n=1 Tax=Streptomyces sp. NPDC051578 TaxID=3365662 RepID=UPI003790CF74
MDSRTPSRTDLALVHQLRPVLRARSAVVAGRLLRARNPGLPLIEREARVDRPDVSRARRATRWCGA